MTLQARNDRPLAALFDILWGSEVAKKKEQRESVKYILEGMEFNRKPRRKGGKEQHRIISNTNLRPSIYARTL